MKTFSLPYKMKTFLVTYQKTIEVSCLILAHNIEEALEKHGEGGEAWLRDSDITDDSNLDGIEILDADQAREYAKDWQQRIGDISISYGELADEQAVIAAMGEQFGLTEEFRENGLV